MGAADPEARHVEGIVVSVRGIKDRLAALVDAAAACASKAGGGDNTASNNRIDFLNKAANCCLSFYSVIPNNKIYILSLWGL
jgi:hypothetical protein